MIATQQVLSDPQMDALENEIPEDIRGLINGDIVSVISPIMMHEAFYTSAVVSLMDRHGFPYEQAVKLLDTAVAIANKNAKENTAKFLADKAKAAK